MKFAFPLLIVVASFDLSSALPVAEGPYDKSFHDDHHDPHGDYHEPHGYHELLGRVKIQAYRGPSVLKKDGYHKEYFAPFGHYQTQPEDAKKKKYHH